MISSLVSIVKGPYFWTKYRLAGEVVEYHNRLGQAAEPVTDTSAFATCP